MNKQRKQIIISEIKYWKQSKLLPGHYCDFLITLYAQGEDDQEDVQVSNSILIKEKKRLNRYIMLLVLLVSLLSGSLFAFANYPAETLSLAAVVVFILIFLSMRKSISKSAILPFLYISSAFLLLLMSLKLWLVFFEAYPMLLVSLLMLNCILWLFIGRLLKLIYFTISGAAGILLIILFLFTQF